MAVGDIEGESAAAVAEEIATSGGVALSASTDGRDRASLAALADLAVATYGGVHVLSTNVGVFADRALDSASEQDWAWIIELNLMSAIRAVGVFLPCLRASGGPAAVVVTASMAALLCSPPARVSGVNLGLYTTTKHALLGYTESLRAELEPEGIGVSVLCPGQRPLQLDRDVPSARTWCERAARRGRGWAADPGAGDDRGRGRPLRGTWHRRQPPPHPDPSRRPGRCGEAPEVLMDDFGFFAGP